MGRHIYIAFIALSFIGKLFAGNGAPTQLGDIVPIHILTKSDVSQNSELMADSTMARLKSFRSIRFTLCSTNFLAAGNTDKNVINALNFYGATNLFEIYYTNHVDSWCAMVTRHSLLPGKDMAIAVSKQLHAEHIEEIEWAVSEEVLKELGKQVGEAESGDIKNAWPKSYAAGYFYEIAKNSGRVDDQQGYLARAIEIDPHFGYALASMGVLLAQRGQFEEAESIESGVLSNCDSDDYFKRQFSIVAYLTGKTNKSLVYLRQAYEQDPFNWETCNQIYNFLGADADGQESNGFYNIEKKIAPDSALSKYLSSRLQYLGERKQSRYFPTNGLDFSIDGLSSGIMISNSLQNDGQAIKNPMLASLDMTNWSLSVTMGATNERSKAQMLFNAIEKNVNISNGFGYSGLEVSSLFSKMTNNNCSLNCQDLSQLYVGLARSVGLKAFEVWVDRDYRGGKVLHTCAGVLLGDKVILADPAYSWFGIPHKEFRILNNNDVFALYLSCRPTLAEKREACRLSPNFALVQYNLFEKLINNNLWDEAGDCLTWINRNDRTGFLSASAEAFNCKRQKNYEKSVDVLKSAMGTNDVPVFLRIQLADALAMSGRYREALDGFLNAKCLPHALDEDEEIDRCVARINAIVSAYIARGHDNLEKTNIDASLADFSSAISINPNISDAFFWRACAYQRCTNYGAALEGFTRVIELSPGTVDAYLHRGRIRDMVGDQVGAANDFSEYVELQPFDKITRADLKYLGVFFYKVHLFKNSYAVFRFLCGDSCDAFSRVFLTLSGAAMGRKLHASADENYSTKCEAACQDDVRYCEVYKYLTGGQSESDLLNKFSAKTASGDKGFEGECNFYIGERRLFFGDEQGALDCFRKCTNCACDYSVEYQCSLSELNKKYLTCLMPNSNSGCVAAP